MTRRIRPNRRSTSLLRISDAAQEKTRAACPVLDGEEKRVIDMDFDRLGFGFFDAPCLHHDNRRRGSGFCAVLVDGQEGLMENLLNIEVRIRGLRSHEIEVRAAFWDVEGAFHAE